MTNYAFQSLFDFTRTTSGTFVGSDGLIQTTPASVNLLLQTQDFDNAAWVKFNATITANTTAAPDGTTTADKLVENTAVTVQHRVSQVVATTSGSTYVYSVYVKAAERTSVQLRVIGATTFAAATFNLLTGTFSGNIGAGSTIISVGDGWYRISVSGTADSTAPLCYVNLVDAGSISYTGDGTSGVFLWGAQLEAAATASTYTRNNGGVYPARFDYDPATLQPKGILIEEQRVNLIFPADGTTGWSASPASSVTATANSIVSPDGTTNATKLSMGDLSNAGHTWFKTYAGAVNTTYVGSVYLKAGEYTRSQVTFGNTAFAATTGAIFDLSNGTVVVTAGGSTATITAVGNGWYRCTVTATSDADGGNYVFGASPKPASVTTIDATFTPASVGLGGYVYGIQVEAGAFATSYIPTVASQVTRSTDIATMTGTNFSSWYNQTEGTIVASILSAPVNTIAQQALYLSDGTSSNIIFTRRAVGGSVATAVTTGGVVQGDVSAGSAVAGSAAYKYAFAYAANDLAESVNGSAVGTDTSATIPTLSQMNLGATVANTQLLNGHIRSVQYFPVRLADFQLQALTA